MSWLFSYIVDLAYEYTTWQSLCSLLLVDLLFLYLISESRINYIKKRWVCSIFLIIMAITSTFLLLTFSYTYYIISSDIYLYTQPIYNNLSIVLSSLICVVGITPQKLVGYIDDLLWPDFAVDICISCDVDIYQDSGESS